VDQRVAGRPGQGEGTLTGRVGENNAGSSRTGIIVLNDARVPHTGASASVNVVTLAGCT